MGNDICTERTPDDMHLLGRRQGMDPRGASPGSCLVRGRGADLGSSHGGSRTVFFLSFFFLIHFVLAVLGLYCCLGFSLVGARGVYSVYTGFSWQSPGSGICGLSSRGLQAP